MSESCINSNGWKLRAGQPQVVCARSSEDCECSPGIRNTMVLQSFGMEVITGRQYMATDTLPLSTEFIGMSTDGTLENANFNASQYSTLQGELVYQGSEQLLTTYSTEDHMPGFNVDDTGALFV
jgi:hypothetical protein